MFAILVSNSNALDNIERMQKDSFFSKILIYKHKDFGGGKMHSLVYLHLDLCKN